MRWAQLIVRVSLVRGDGQMVEKNGNKMQRTKMGARERQIGVEKWPQRLKIRTGEGNTANDRAKRVANERQAGATLHPYHGEQSIDQSARSCYLAVQILRHTCTIFSVRIKSVISLARLPPSVSKEAFAVCSSFDAEQRKRILFLCGSISANWSRIVRRS